MSVMSDIYIHMIWGCMESCVVLKFACCVYNMPTMHHNIPLQVFAM